MSKPKNATHKGNRQTARQRKGDGLPATEDEVNAAANVIPVADADLDPGDEVSNEISDAMMSAGNAAFGSAVPVLDGDADANTTPKGGRTSVELTLEVVDRASPALERAQASGDPLEGKTLGARPSLTGESDGVVYASVRVPFLEPQTGGHRPRRLHVEVQLAPEQADAFAAVREALEKTGARTRKGHLVTRNADVVRWLCEQAGDAIAALQAVADDANAAEATG